MDRRAVIRWRRRSAATSIQRPAKDPTSPPAIQSYLVCVLLHLVLEESGANQRPSSNGGKPNVCSFISPENLSSSTDGGWADSDTGLTPESRVAAFAGFQATECLDCKNPYDVCGDVEGPSCHISVPMTTFYWFESVRPSHHDVALLFFNLVNQMCYWNIGRCTQTMNAVDIKDGYMRILKKAIALVESTTGDMGESMQVPM